ncbi:hypothetical protein E7735_18440 [Enterobacter cloacae]|uniref:AMP-binding protein n=1 Tax=Enterobacter cloacae TaxID=550 RepID=UPI000D39019C|nr:AMP-binding protein [Enterobacter cloacae]MCL8313814.1 AMP-binding protein [Enterobacter cloacae subsp. cloacae]QCC92806.1 hypothetical protein E7735_18440 [Enterobacter cloacae]QCC97806.1 hypothetical protein E7739_18135 [Enterobacter cloacae]QCD10263.1 hypothetical protein E7729_06485 [Enterobacter cloacae]
MKLAYANGLDACHPLWNLSTLAEALQLAAEESDNGIVTVNHNGEQMFRRYRDFYHSALAVSHVLAEQRIKPGERVLLRLKNPDQFLLSLWGCLLLGAVAVPVSARQPLPQEGDALAQALAVLDLIRPVACITTGEDLDVLRANKAPIPLRIIDAQTFLFLPPKKTLPGAVAGVDDLAIIFPTSGSTGQPKLVPQTVGGLLSMASGSVQMNDFSEEDRFLNWMPMDHVGAVAFLGILPVCCRAQQVHLEHQWVEQDLSRFPQAVSRYRATVSWVPNHVFSQLSKMQPLPQWDVSSLRFLVNAGESIGDQMYDCAQRYAAQGLRPDALRPAFGMSETCSGITWADGRHTRVRGYVDLGEPIPGVRLRIVDATGKVLCEGETGDLQVCGGPITRGYFNGDAEECFLPQGWFATGDRAFIQHGHLFITDREGDGIEGVPMAGYQLEGELERLEGVRAGYTAVCQANGETGIFFVPEAGHSAGQVAAGVRARFAELVGHTDCRVFACDESTVPRTSIGKIQRKVLRRRLAAYREKEMS